MVGVLFVVFFQAEDGIRDLVRSRGLGDVYKRQASMRPRGEYRSSPVTRNVGQWGRHRPQLTHWASSVSYTHLTLPTSELV